MADGLPVPDDLVVDIFSLLPVKSLCRSKCVSTTWRDLISHPDHRRRLPQTLAGFFYRHADGVSVRCFTNFSERGQPLPSSTFDFLPKYHQFALLDCCNGLLLCRCWDAPDDFHYVVCNPATKQWFNLPESSQAGKMCIARLGFDPAVSSHFHVFEFLEDVDIPLFSPGVLVYSSSTGGWVHNVNGWNGRLILVENWSSTVFLNGCLHVLTTERASLLDAARERVVAVVDTEGKTRRKISLPDDLRRLNLGFIQQSQGCLHYANFQRKDGGVRVEIYALENYGSHEWRLKHSAEPSRLFGGGSESLLSLLTGFRWVAIHPDCSLVFFTSMRQDKTLLCYYDMDSQQAQVIRDLGDEFRSPYLPYVPLYTELCT